MCARTHGLECDLGNGLVTKVHRHGVRRDAIVVTIAPVNHVRAAGRRKRQIRFDKFANGKFKGFLGFKLDGHGALIVPHRTQ